MENARSIANEDNIQQNQAKPLCAVYGVEKCHPNSASILRRRGGGARVDIDMHYDENSYLSVGRTRNIFERAGEEQQTLGLARQRNTDELLLGEEADDELPLTAFSPLRMLTTLTHCEYTEWDKLREIRVRELREARQRVTLMENTMRWWLSAAQQWREKWLKLKSERIRLREENLRLRNALSHAKVKLSEFHGLKHGGKCTAAVRMPKNDCAKMFGRAPKIVDVQKCENKESWTSLRSSRRRSNSV